LIQENGFLGASDVRCDEKSISSNTYETRAMQSVVYPLALKPLSTIFQLLGEETGENYRPVASH
jgi:hypothetical protein